MPQQMIYNATAHLDNLYGPAPESEDIMALNTSKIRRIVKINGVNLWICANSEQEYADKIAALNAANNTGPKHLFKDYAEYWFESYSKPNVAHVTSKCYRMQLDLHILPVIGNCFLEDVKPVDVQRIFNAMGKECKQQTKNKVKIVLNQVFKTALDEELITRNPLQSNIVKIKGLASEVTKPYTVEQMKYLAAHLKDIQSPQDKMWLALCISLPLRLEETLGLKWEDVDTNTGIITIRGTVTHPDRNLGIYKPYTKTAASVRNLKLPDFAFRCLPQKTLHSDFVIGGKVPVSYTQLRHMCGRIKKQTNFSENIVPRRFRTTVATDISAMTHDLKLVQHMLGHSSPQMTLKHYDKGRANSSDASVAVEQCYLT